MEPAVQAVYRSYVLAAARKLNPEFIGLAAETNLIRAAAPPAVYAAVVRAANDAAADLRAAGFERHRRIIVLQRGFERQCRIRRDPAPLYGESKESAQPL